MKLLFVEDEVLDAELALRSMRRAGLQCTDQRVDTEEGFVRALTEFRPDIILSDFSMPQFDGLTALRIAHERCPEVPFIFVSGTIGEEYAIRALKNGAVDYVLKSNLARLAPAVERAIEEAQQQVERQRIAAALRLSEQRFRLAASTGDVWDWSVDSGASYIPQQWKQRHGYADEDLPNRWSTWGELLHPDDRGQVRLALLQHLKNDVPYEQEFRTRDASGGYRWSHVKGLGLRNEAGRVAYMAGTVVDITERKLAEIRVQRLNRVYALHSGLGSLIVRAQGREELFREACRIAVDVGGFRSARVWLQPAGKPDAVLLASEAALDAPAAPGQLQDLVLRVLQGGPALYEELPSGAIALQAISVAGDRVGVLALQAADADFFDAAERRLLGEIVNDLSFALDHIAKAEKLNYFAYYDALTGLANRSLYMERLTQFVEVARREGHKLAVLAINVDRFKSINESLGYAAGDELLKQLAQRLLERATDAGWYARIDADHFALVVPEVQSEEALARTMEVNSNHYFTRPFEVAGAELRLSARIGIAMFPTDGSNADELYMHAQAAAEKARARGERFLFYAQEMSDKIAGALALENKLRRAQDRQEFLLHYQPKLCTRSGRILGVEALIRWQDPEQGLVPPGHFIPLMEETGLIIEVGAWALRRAVCDQLEWQALGLGNAPRVAVNVSAIQLRRSDFVQTVERAMALAGGPPGIDIEITESLVMEDIHANIRKLEQVRALGLSIAVDDFGTGYSSLRYLAQLPVQTLKIDRSFVSTMLREPSTMTLVATVISLAHTLRLKVVAEGVETEEQAQRLRELGCDELQGYWFSRPLSFQAMTELLRAHQRRVA